MAVGGRAAQSWGLCWVFNSSTFHKFFSYPFYPSENLQPEGNEVLPLSLCALKYLSDNLNKRLLPQL